MKGPAKPAHAATAEIWRALRAQTPARIGLGHAGVSLPTCEVLQLARAHALARDAVHAQLNIPQITAELESLGQSVAGVRSAAPTRAAYLARPDWGRKLHADAEVPVAHAGPDVVIIISDGLSATAVHRHAVPLLRMLLPHLSSLRLGPIIVAEQARVAIADDIGERMQARLAVNLIGERPGLSAPDSLGAYLTYHPKVGNTDAQRNCVSNIRPQGLGYGEAAQQIAGLLHAALKYRRSGVSLQASLPD